MGWRRMWRLAPLAAGLMLAACAHDTGTARPLALPDAESEAERALRHFTVLQQLYGGPYRADPGLNAYVNGVGHRVGAAAGAPRTIEFVVLQHRHPESWALPGGKVAVSVGLLLHLDNEAELAAVLGHQLARSATLRWRLDAGRDAAWPTLAVPGAPRDQRLRSIIGPARESLQWLADTPVWDASGAADELAMQWLARAGYDPGAVPALLDRLRTLADGAPVPHASRLLAEAPRSTYEAREAQARLAAGLPGRRDLNEGRFADAVAHVRSRADAYRIAAAVERALADGWPERARADVEMALAIEADDPWLHALRADADAALGNVAAALAGYSHAQRLAPEQFEFPLARGLLRSRHGDLAGARIDLEHSLAIVPTALALFELGRLAEFLGDRTAAMGHYRRAAESACGAGRAAMARVIGMDLPRNPARYLSVRIVDDAGHPAVQVANLTDVDLFDVNVRVRLEWADGLIDDLLPKLSRLDARQQTLLPLPTRGLRLEHARAFPVTARTPVPL
jgi:beta-barrel assembly-enhancing protease